MPLDLNTVFIDRVLRTNVDAVDFSSKNLAVQRQCGDIEQDALECLEAYGSRRGHRLCKDFLDDYRECSMQLMQNERVKQMKRERIKQVMRGERKFSEALDSIKPPRDAYQQGPFYN